MKDGVPDLGSLKSNVMCSNQRSTKRCFSVLLGSYKPGARLFDGSTTYKDIELCINL